MTDAIFDLLKRSSDSIRSGLSAIYTIGHGTRPLEELVGCLLDAGVQTVVDVRRYPGSRRHPQFGQEPLAEAVRAGGIEYRHAVDLGGRRHDEHSAETAWWRCHRRLIADAVVARGLEVRHLGRRHGLEGHRLFQETEVRAGRLYVCGEAGRVVRLQEGSAAASRLMKRQALESRGEP